MQIVTMILMTDRSSVLEFALFSVATCHDPTPPMKVSIGGYTSTVEGSVVTFHCNEGLIPAEQMNTTCASNGSWTPNPAELICSDPPSDGEGQLSVDSLISVPDPKPTPAQISIPRVILKAICTPDEVWGRDYG